MSCAGELLRLARPRAADVLADEHREYLGLGTEITLSLTVADVGVVLSLLADHGYTLEVNVGAPT
jgi:hypothetical protein